jgi:glycosyltransferase involved in cell wall biosynthesis
MKDKVSVDVLLITYNQERFVSKAVESVLMQVVDESVSVSVVIADDCSTDYTLGLIKAYQEKSPFPFVFLKRETNVGIARNYQLAIEKCTGDYLAIIEGDDYWVDNMRLKKHLDYLESHRDCVMTVNSRLEYDQRRKNYLASKSDGYSRDFCFSLSDAIADYDFIRNLSTSVFRKEVLDQMNPRLFESANRFGGICVDTYMVHDVLQRGYGFHFSERMSAYRINTGHNASFKQNETASIEEQIEWYQKMFTEANSLLELDYSFEFNLLFEKRKKELEDLHSYLKKVKLSRYISPIFVDLCFSLPQIGRGIKKSIRAFIPNGLYSKMKSIKTNTE